VGGNPACDDAVLAVRRTETRWVNRDRIRHQCHCWVYPYIQNSTNIAAVNSSSYAGSNAFIVGGTISGNLNGEAVKVKGGNVLLAGDNPNPSGNPNGYVVSLTGGGTITTNSPDAPTLLSQAAAEMTAYSNYYAGLLTNSTVTVTTDHPPGPVTFNAMANAPGGIAVFSVDASLFSDGNSQNYFLNTAAGDTTYIINVTGTSVNFSQGNFQSGFQSTNANILFNFINATSITGSNNVYGTILAPLATVTNFSTQQGGLFVANFTQTQEVHLPTFAGAAPPPAVPEPSSLALVTIGLPAGVLFALRQRRRAA
jgi:choice-of-anchor A domain-containing protein